MDAWLICVVVAATSGGTLIGFLGWAKQKPPVPFDWKDFIVTMGDSLIAGAAYAVTLATRTENFTKDIIIAAIFGAGGDMLIKGVIGTIQSKRGQSPPPAA